MSVELVSSAFYIVESGEGISVCLRICYPIVMLLKRREPTCKVLKLSPVTIAVVIVL